jgi:hypothetical protein
MSEFMSGVRLAGALVVSTLAVSAFAASGLADKPGLLPGTTICTPFVGSKWVNPYPPHEIGDHYQIIVAGKAFTCKSALPYVVKFIAEKIKAPKTGPPIGTVKGGPAGYKCTSGIGNTGTAYQGQCMAPHPAPGSSSFTWSPFNDS